MLGFEYDLEKDEWKEGEIFIFKSFHVILFSFGPPIYPISIRKKTLKKCCKTKSLWFRKIKVEGTVITRKLLNRMTTINQNWGHSFYHNIGRPYDVSEMWSTELSIYQIRIQHETSGGQTIVLQSATTVHTFLWGERTLKCIWCCYDANSFTRHF